MEKRHDDILMGRMDEVLTKGCSFVWWQELYLWYDKDKIAAKTYRDLDRRWQDVSTGKNAGSLLMAEDPGKSGIHLFPDKRLKRVDPDYSGFSLES